MAGQSEYWSALDRLIADSPIRVQKGSPINKDTVALEAGRKRGAIKKSRPANAKLICAIEAAAKPTAQGSAKSTEVALANVREKYLDYRRRYHLALGREVLLIEKLKKLEKELRRFNNLVLLKE